LTTTARASVWQIALGIPTGPMVRSHDTDLGTILYGSFSLTPHVPSAIYSCSCGLQVRNKRYSSADLTSTFSSRWRHARRWTCIPGHLPHSGDRQPPSESPSSHASPCSQSIVPTIVTEGLGTPSMLDEVGVLTRSRSLSRSAVRAWSVTALDRIVSY